VYPTGIELRANHRLHSDRPATKCLSGGKALLLLIPYAKYLRILLESCSCDLKHNYILNVFQTIIPRDSQILTRCILRKFSVKLTISLETVLCNSQRSTYCIPRQRTSSHHTLDRQSLDPIQPQTRCSTLYHLSHLYFFPCSPGLTACP